MLSDRFTAAQMRLVDRKKQNFIALTAKLDAMSPLKVLSRGYSMAQKEDGAVVRSTRQLAVGDTVRISLSDGRVTASVTDVKEDSL